MMEQKEFDYKMRSVVAEWQTELSKDGKCENTILKAMEDADELSYDVIKKGWILNRGISTT